MIELYSHQSEALKVTADKNRVAYYHDMGLGKTFTGAEKLVQLGARVNLIICQKSKIDDWIDHFKSNYNYAVFDLTNKKDFDQFIFEDWIKLNYVVGVINYELAFRRPELSKLTDFTLILDESSLIQNEQAKRSKFILKKLQPANVILLSGTPTGGKYENLWSQMRLLGWDISKTTYWNTYIDYHYEDMGGFPVKFIDGYKNVERLKRKMREYGCHFLKTDEVMDLPDQIFTKIKVPASNEYKKFRKDRVVEVDVHYTKDISQSFNYEGERVSTQLVGDNTLTKMLYERMLCGSYNEEKLRQLIITMGLNEVDVAKVLEKKRNNEFPMACVRYFEAKFPGVEHEKVGVHPNHYFISAMKALRKKTKIEYEKGSNTQEKKMQK